VAQSSGQPLVRIESLCVAFDGVPVLHGIDLTVAPGEALGLVGESGSGKSVTWLAALGLLPSKASVTGRVTLDGQGLLGAPPATLSQVRGGRIAMIFQDPASALNPVLSIRRQICEALALHRALSGAAAVAEARRLLDLVGIPDAARRLSAYPHEFSGGQNQRIMIAMALAGQPDLLIADEPTTALDATIQAQILELIQQVRRETGMALVLISHDLGVVADVCDRVAVMYAGRIVEEASADELFRAPFHPYAQGLIGALPPLDGERRRLTAIPGTVPDPRDLPPGCSFAPRCGRATPDCRSWSAVLTPRGAQRRVACLHAGPALALPAAGRLSA
jgi:peptide/nickel transport system ATP-binding protein